MTKSCAKHKSALPFNHLINRPTFMGQFRSEALFDFGVPGRNRTTDTRIFNPDICLDTTMGLPMKALQPISKHLQSDGQCDADLVRRDKASLRRA